MSTRTLVASCVLAAFATGSAHADTQLDDPALGIPEKAHLLSDRGRQLQRDGKYGEAIEAYKAAYVLAPSPGLLFNLAQVYRLNGNCDDAAWMYRRFLATDPREDLAAVANANLDKLASCSRGGGKAELAMRPAAKRTAQADLPTSNFERDADDEGHGKRRVGTYVVIGGVAILAVAAAFAIDGHLAANDVAEAYAGKTVHPDLHSLDDRGRRDDSITAVAGIAGGAVLITGVVLYGLGRREQAQHLAFVPHRDGGLVKVAWQF